FRATSVECNAFLGQGDELLEALDLALPPVRVEADLCPVRPLELRLVAVRVDDRVRAGLRRFGAVAGWLPRRGLVLCVAGRLCRFGLPLVGLLLVTFLPLAGEEHFLAAPERIDGLAHGVETVLGLVLLLGFTVIGVLALVMTAL